MSYGNVKPPIGTQLNLGHPLSYGLVGCWLFNEDSGTKSHDYSEQQGDGIFHGISNPSTPTSGWASGSNGSIITFDGIDDYIDCGNASPLQVGVPLSLGNGRGTLLAWVNTTDSSAGYHGIAVKWGAYGIFNVAGVFTPYNYGGPTPNIPFTMADGYWHLVGFTFVNDWTQSLSIAYVDGKAIGSPFPYWENDQTKNFTIGAVQSGSPIQYFIGSISNVMMWNRTLSAEEIAYLYAFPYAIFDIPAVVDIHQYYVKPPTKGRLPVKLF